MERGIVTSIDRTNRLVRAVLLDHLNSEIEASYMGDPPWPLSTAWFFDDSPRWGCVGPIGDRRIVLRDDFMYVAGPTSNIVSADTPWFAFSPGSSTFSQLTGPGAGAAGAVAMSSVAPDNCRMRKIDQAANLQEDDLGLWWSARVRMNSNLQNSNNGTVACGLGNNNVANPTGLAGSDVGVYFTYQTSHTWRANTQEGTTILATTTGETHDNGGWCWLDIVAVSDEWCAFWIDGSGPYVNTTEVPDFGDQGIEPFFYVLAGTGTCILYVDVCELQIAGPVNHPTAFALDPAAQWSFGL